MFQMKFPEKFKGADYVEWHHQECPIDIDLPAKLDQLRLDLKTNTHENLLFLSELISFFIKGARQEYKNTNKSTNPPEYENAIQKALTEKKKGNEDNYNLLFKTTSSIINKQWRKYAKEKKIIPLESIKTTFTDLIRTEIIADTLESAAFLAKRFKRGLINSKLMEVKYDKNISDIEIEPEMKMNSGYFAYHILVNYKDGTTVEVQIYSAIIKKWRDLSRTLYDSERINPTEVHEFATTESRLISLGHLFHIAECEIQSLQQALRNKSH